MHEGHEHEYWHTHEHEHTHSHTHTHEHSHAHETKDENTALLHYMLHHNEEHAKELTELAQTLREAGKTAAADQIDAAVKDFDAGNAKLAKALESAEEV